MKGYKKPRFEHDCDRCAYLGRFENFDLYWCKSPSLPSLDSLIARFGRQGQQYKSSHPPECFVGNPDDFVRKYAEPWYRVILARGKLEGLYVTKCACPACPPTDNSCGWARNWEDGLLYCPACTDYVDGPKGCSKTIARCGRGILK